MSGGKWRKKLRWGERLSPEATWWAWTITTFGVISGAGHLLMWVLHRHRDGVADAIVGLIEGLAAGLVGGHFKRRAEARDAQRDPP